MEVVDEEESALIVVRLEKNISTDVNHNDPAPSKSADEYPVVLSVNQKRLSHH